MICRYLLPVLAIFIFCSPATKAEAPEDVVKELKVEPKPPLYMASSLKGRVEIKYHAALRGAS